MNILFYQYGSICEPDIIEGFEELGFHVDSISEEIENKSLTGKEQIYLMDQALSRKDYQFVFTINFYPAISECCNIYHIPYLCLIVDSPVLELYSDAIKNPCNRIFLFDRALYEEFSPANPDCIFHMPLATNVKRWDHVLSNALASQKSTFTSDISFIGSLYSEKCPYYELHFSSDYYKGYVEGLLQAQKKVYGYFFLEEALDNALVDDIITHTPNFYQFPERSNKNYRAALAQFYLGPRITEMERIEMLSALGSHFSVDLYSGSNVKNLPVNYRGRVKTHTEMPLVFHKSAINLNMTAKSIRTAIPLRVWDVFGCSGFLISNYQSEIPDYFVPGEDIVLYSSKDELVELTQYYLSHASERKEIARNAYEKVKTYHTYPIRLTEMLEKAFHL